MIANFFVTVILGLARMRLAATFFSPLRACLAGDSWWQPPLKSFNAEPQRAAMNALTCSVRKTRMHYSDCQPTVADCAGDGTLQQHPSIER